MNISIFGLGYVGCVSLGCLAKMGHHLIGVDINESKNSLINQGIPTIIEKDIEHLIAAGHEKGQIRATSNSADAVLKSDMSFICVGTPNDKNGHLNLKHIRTVAAEIGAGLKQKGDFHVIVIRSTVMPGTTEEITEIIADKSNKIPDTDFCVLGNPEFLREGTAVADFFNPSITIIGGSCLKGIDILLELYRKLPGSKEIVESKVAESIKLLNNSFHALKVAFANEVGNISKALGINTRQLIEIFLLDTKLNISPAYLRPGFAFGGSCLPKDLKALNLLAHDAYLDTPLLNSIEKSNQQQIDRAVKLIEEKGIRHIGFWGISFKEGTDDLRNSPAVQVIERLLGKGYQISVFDENVNASALIGANKEYIEKVLPHFPTFLVKDLKELIGRVGLIVVNKRGSENNYQDILSKSSLCIIDLKDIPALSKHEYYEGINW